jgi:hypothetical protein
MEACLIRNQSEMYVERITARDTTNFIICKEGIKAIGSKIILY